MLAPHPPKKPPTNTQRKQADLHTKLPDAELNLALENHEVAVLPPQYERWPILKKWYNILSTTLDRNGVEYISTIEGKKYPFTGVT
jgi:gamma-glutamyl hydrolase